MDKLLLRRSVHMHHRRQERFTPTAVFSNQQTSTSAAQNGANGAARSSSSSPSAAPSTTSSARSSITSTSTGTTSSSSSTTSTRISSTSSRSSTSTTSAVAQTQAPVPATFQTQPTTSFTPIPATTPFHVSSSTLKATSTPASNPSGISTTGLVGIAAGSVLGIAVFAGVLMYLFRKCRRRDIDLDNFDAPSFRRQSVALPENNSSPMYNNGSPRPPTMIQRHVEHVASVPPHALAPTPINTQFNFSQQGGGYGRYPQPGNGAGVGAGAGGYYQPSFNPGDVMPQANNQYAPYNPTTQSPVTTPTDAPPYPSAYDAQGRLIRQPSHSNTLRPNPPFAAMDGGYADMTRSSVTPFQAEQYAAISKQLGTEPPVPSIHDLPLPPIPIDDEMQLAASTASSESPFSDPDNNEFRPAPWAGPNAFPGAGIPVALTPGGVGPVPPSKMRTSPPPTLPEIRLPHRAFSPIEAANFPESAHPSPTLSAVGFGDVGSGARPGPGQGMVPQPSPLANSFSASQMGTNASVAVPLAAHVGHGPGGDGKTSMERKRETVYDDEDAYGGLE